MSDHGNELTSIVRRSAVSHPTEPATLRVKPWLLHWLAEDCSTRTTPSLRASDTSCPLLVLLPPAHPADGDFIDYNNLLRNGILDAYSGIIQGMGQAKADQYLKAELPDIINFVSSIGAESDPDEDVARSAVNLLGDICSVFLVRVVGALCARVLSGMPFRCR